uniref:Choline transporter-like protein n=1 Tax=Chromera velia CCMP2878 TaxID=1169474 RepID=A0A0G4FZX4_9ALVE|mmetsp:Transcript_11115/g.21462  ORF Transcript_11115/g.21462 Transcript_11115/m.21462 type:complete len:641 (+) Transcript_11115:185-2107(+)|eukprot:Cvel_518.t1-p1 / transcript=Cvel_518.t1 / gene=Cvel_518 / organism=Chromera_velia_CCMP2878 / gene_product=CTL-like protein 1, putative / transcript_product=CTL-like protein 1, putative / location=Cvel_scaffold16:76479-87843(+) / protein_length=640 / sequence_SO=supercontig / SO=protein_coding / is_pseudo=false
MYGSAGQAKDRMREVRGCTDVIFGIIFVAFFAATVGLFMHGYIEGDMRRLYHGFNYAGKMCGIDETVANKPYVYWPVKPNTEDIDFQTPICVAKCWSSADLAGEYRDVRVKYPEVSSETTLEGGNQVVDTEKITYTTQVPYGTRHVAHAYCIPEESSSFTEQFKNNQAINSSAAHLRRALSSLGSMWPLLVVSGVVALGLAFLYLWLLSLCAGVMVVTMLVVTISVLAGLGGYALYHYLYPDAEYQMSWITEDHMTYALVIAIVCLTLAGLLALFSICFCRSIRIVIGAVDAASDCIFDMPKLLLNPIVNCTVQIAWYSFCVFGILHLLSLGEVTSNNKGTIGLGDNGTGSLPVYGLHRDFVVDDTLWAKLGICFFGMLWFAEWVGALGQFVTAYAVCDWYFTPPDSSGDRDVGCPVWEGFGVGMFYHTGTLAIGAFLLAVCRFIKAVLEYLKRQTQQSTPDNPVVQTFICVAECLVSCCECLIRYLNSFVWIEVALNSNGYCASASAAFGRLASAAPTFALLEGAGRIFSFVGELGISAGLAFLCYFLMENTTVFTDQDSAFYVENKELGLIFVFLISLACAMLVMHMFDEALHGVVYCFLEEAATTGRTQCTPPSLQDLLSSTEYEAKQVEMEDKGMV